MIAISLSEYAAMVFGGASWGFGATFLTALAAQFPSPAGWPVAWATFYPYLQAEYFHFTLYEFAPVAFLVDFAFWGVVAFVILYLVRHVSR